MPDVSDFKWVLENYQEFFQTPTSDEDYRFDLEQLARASAVLDAIATQFGDPFEDDLQQLRDEYKLRVNKAINTNLDLDSIWSFMGIVAANYKSLDASRKAHIKNATNRMDMKWTPRARQT